MQKKIEMAIRKREKEKEKDKEKDPPVTWRAERRFSH